MRSLLRVVGETQDNTEYFKESRSGCHQFSGLQELLQTKSSDGTNVMRYG